MSLVEGDPRGLGDGQMGAGMCSPAHTELTVGPRRTRAEPTLNGTSQRFLRCRGDTRVQPPV